MHPLSLACCISSPGEPVGSKFWIGACKGFLEKTGICRRPEECKRAGFRRPEADKRVAERV
jgi:hypothetical protein